MNRLWSLLLLALLLCAGCARSGSGSGIRSGVSMDSFPPPPGPPATVTIGELVEEPAAYEGQYVRVTGAYRRPPLLVCEGLPRHSPDGWALAEGEATIGAGGFNELLRSLLAEGTTITVDGRWLQWTGPVGCGKTAGVEEIWYLAVQNVVEPHPLVRATPGTVTAVAGAPTALPGATAPATALPSPTGVTPLSPASATPTPTLAAPAGTATGSPEPYPGATQTATVTPAGTPGTGTPGTPQVTLTGTVITATATAATGTPGTPQATATETGGEVVDRGDMAFQPLLGNQADFSPLALEIALLEREEEHLWRFDVQAGDIITASVGGQPDRDMILQLRDPAGNVLVTQNAGGAGEVETIAGHMAATAGDYQLIVREADLGGGEYALLALNSEYGDYYHYVIAGILRANGTANATMPANTDYLWLFMADPGDVVTITVSPNDTTDLILNLLSPTADLLYQYIDDRGAGQSELILNASLPDAGLYVLHVAENEFAPSSYQVVISGN